ncbi:MAG: hypothetical protein WBJ81_01705 [Rickettsiales bacterium]
MDSEKVSTPEAIDDISKIPKEEWEERSWDFLTIITEIVEALPKEIQTRIVELGRQLAQIGASYNHDSSKPHRPPLSPAKQLAAKEQKSGNAASA